MTQPKKIDSWQGLVLPWAMAFIPQWLFWDMWANVLGTITALAGVPFAWGLLVPALVNRNRKMLWAGGAMAAFSKALLAGVDEQVKARVTLLTHKGAYESIVQQIEADPSSPQREIIDVDETNGNVRVACIEGVNPACQFKSIVYDPSGSVVDLATSEDASVFSGGISYASRITGHWYYCVLTH